ncbi:hypothetical protein [Asticcacaulis solisilvae]|uniref:hypothetical protein n=1 Tax=Asticcacaulis solisilvae TaxID=1217274 RepID=UPI003FD85EB4
MTDTITEKVVWTLCPNGRDTSGRMHLSAFVAPQLKVDPTGKTTLLTPTAWQNWPKTLGTISISVMVAGQPVPLPLKPVSKVSIDIYSALFPSDTPVVSFNTKTLESLKSAMILSYPVRTLADHIENIYGALATATSEELPKAKALTDAGWPGYRTPEERRQATATPVPTHKQRLDGMRKLMAAGPLTNSKAVFEAFSLYHTPLQAETTMKQQHFGPPTPVHAHAVPPKAGVEAYAMDAKWPGYVDPKALPSAADLKAITDFHKIVAGLSNYYQLARLCGFVIDFTLEPADAAKVPAGADVALSFQVLRNKVAHPEIDTCAITHCTVAPQVFAARGGDKHDNGFLRMHENGVSFVQLDVDGAAHKMAALGSSLERMTITNFDDDEVDGMRQDDMQTGTPSLRSAGLMLAKSGRGADLTARAKRNSDLHGAATPELGFGDLLRGYRADILDLDGPDGQWRSLHRRVISYGLKNGAKLDDSPEEEGVLSTAAGSSADGSVPDVFTLHEGLFVWRGWSLSAPEPFKTVRHKPKDGVDPKDHTSMIGENTAEIPAGMPLSTTFTVAPDDKGSLPKLRFGHTYSVRMRAVDMCGNSQSYRSKAAPVAISDPVKYRRYEPIESPVLTLVGKTDGGAQATTPWQVTEYPLQGESMTRLALRTRNAVYDDKSIPSDVPAVHRNLWPPRVTERFAEQHGVLDDEHGRMRREVYKMLWTFDNAFTETQLPPSDVIKGVKPVPATYDGPTTSYAVSHTQNPIPYLPDPLAVGALVRMRGLEGGDWKEVFVPFYKTVAADIDAIANRKWDKDAGPTVGGITIEGSETGSFGFKDGVLTVPMPRACRQRLRISFVMPPSKLDWMALWALIDKGKATDAIKTKILQGKHWMFTPWREVELVHAVQKPLEMPIFVSLNPRRPFGATDTDMALVTPVDGPSTVRLDVNASWNEPDDAMVEVDTRTQPVNRPHVQQVVQLPIARRESMGGGSISRQITHHFHDTRARQVTYSMDAISRFREFFELPLRDSESDMKITSQPFTQWIKSSARPPAPAVLYAIPTFGWFNDPEVTASRRTGGIRVWLDRPWLATGYNEMLAVILPDEPDTSGRVTDNAPNLPFVTQWGRDPVWLSSDIKTNSPARHNFPLARMSGPISHPGTGLPPSEGKVPDYPTTGLQVPKQPGTFAVAPHEVGFDADRQLWYADIVVDIPKGSYFPFVRLAVARFQPTSLTSDDLGAAAPSGELNLHLSSPVTCDFMQISPDRIAVAIPTRGNACRVVVFGDVAQSPADKDVARAQPNVVRLRTQVLDEGADPVTGWRDEDGKPSTGPGPIIPDTKADTSGPAARSAAVRLMARDLTEPMKAQPLQAQLQAHPNEALFGAAVTPNVLLEQVVFLPQVPANGKRRILVVESEVYPHLPPGNHEEGPLFAERIIYAEGLEL